MSKTNATETENEPPQAPEVPDLDQIISQITANGEFQEMMNSLSDGLKSVDQGNSPENNNGGSGGEIPSEDNSKNINTDSVLPGPTEYTSNYDICATFFADEEGNNVCESLHGVQKSLDSINANLTKLVEHFSTTSQ